MIRAIIKLFGFLPILTVDLEQYELVDEDEEEEPEPFQRHADTVISEDTYPPTFGFTPWSNHKENWWEEDALGNQRQTRQAP